MQVVNGLESFFLAVQANQVRLGELLGRLYDWWPSFRLTGVVIVERSVATVTDWLEPGGPCINGCVHTSN